MSSFECPHDTGGPFLENKDQFMLGAVETPNPALDLFHTQRSFSSAIRSYWLP
jgi:hypothetical protein